MSSDGGIFGNFGEDVAGKLGKVFIGLTAVKGAFVAATGVAKLLRGDTDGFVESLEHLPILGRYIIAPFNDLREAVTGAKEEAKRIAESVEAERKSLIEIVKLRRESAVESAKARGDTAGAENLGVAGSFDERADAIRREIQRLEVEKQKLLAGTGSFFASNALGVGLSPSAEQSPTVQENLRKTREEERQRVASTNRLIEDEKRKLKSLVEIRDAGFKQLQNQRREQAQKDESQQIEETRAFLEFYKKGVKAQADVARDAADKEIDSLREVAQVKRETMDRDRKLAEDSIKDADKDRKEQEKKRQDFEDKLFGTKEERISKRLKDFFDPIERQPGRSRGVAAVEGRFLTGGAGRNPDEKTAKNTAETVKAVKDQTQKLEDIITAIENSQQSSQVVSIPP